MKVTKKTSLLLLCLLAFSGSAFVMKRKRTDHDEGRPAKRRNVGRVHSPDTPLRSEREATPEDRSARSLECLETLVFAPKSNRVIRSHSEAYCANATNSDGVSKNLFEEGEFDSESNDEG